ncbi:MAG: hypothetical protein AB7O57_08385 [Hyphomicrobiaceae bacterium]
MEATNLREFDLGDVIRYGDGPTAIMKIESITRCGRTRRPQRYYGSNIQYGSVQCNASDARLPSVSDIAFWLKENPMVEPKTPLGWAIEMFGPIAKNRDERAARCAEEALEFAQAEGVSRETVMALVDRVFSRPAGDPLKELHGLALTLHACAENMGNFELDDLVACELTRVRSIPKEQWQRRHAAKAEQGIADLTPKLRSFKDALLLAGVHEEGAEAINSEMGKRADACVTAMCLFRDGATIDDLRRNIEREAQVLLDQFLVGHTATLRPSKFEGDRMSFVWTIQKAA